MCNVTEHFISRLRTRYDLELTVETYIELCQAITLRNGILRSVESRDNNEVVENWSLIVLNRHIEVVFNRTKMVFITALPYKNPVLENRFVQRIRESYKKLGPSIKIRNSNDITSNK